MTKQNKGRKFFATTATAALVASAIVPVASAAELNDFNSIPAWAQDSVQFLVDNGAIAGDQYGNFNPSKSLTRAQAAVILSKVLGLEATGTENFKDVQAGQWFYDAVTATSPEIFSGDEKGNFNPSKALTRQEAAKVLVDAFGLEGTTELTGFSDAAQVPAWSKSYLQTAVANGVIAGKGTLLAPTLSISNAEFATMTVRAMNAAGIVSDVVESITAVNNTTVEVNFKSDIEDIEALDFAIEGLEVTNAVVKQTDKSVAVLTTSAQEGGKAYTVTNAGAKLGTFEGVSAVIPTKVKTVVGSQQGIFGKEVTVSASVEVADGASKEGIPVTFNIQNTEDDNKTIEVEVFTNKDGVAEYSYTRYYKGIDKVAAYSTSKSSVNDNAKVYWAKNTILSVKADDDTKVDNGDRVKYEIKGNGDLENRVVFVAFKENLDVESDKVVDDVYVVDTDIKDENADIQVYDKDANDRLTADEEDFYPYYVDSKDYRIVAILLDEDGEGSFTLTGEGATVTPIVYTDYTDSKLEIDDKEDFDVEDFSKNYEYDRVDFVQAEAEAATFEQGDNLKIDVEAKGERNAAAFDSAEWDLADGQVIANFDWDSQPANLGGRDYVVTVKDEDGDKVGKGYPVHVFVDEDDIDDKEEVFLIDVDGNVHSLNDENVAVLEADKNGQVKFTVVGESTGYASPTVWIDNDKDNDELDKKEPRTVAERVYFKAASIKNAGLKVKDEDGDEITSINAGETASVTYVSVDQNGKPYFNTKDEFVASFTVTAKTTDVELLVDGKTETVKAGKTETFKVDSVEGKSTILVTGTHKGNVTIKASSTSPSLGTVSKSLRIVGTDEVADNLTGTITDFNETRQTIRIDGKPSIKYDLKDDNFFNDSTKKNEEISGSKFEDLLEKAEAEGKAVKVKFEKGEEGNTWTILSIGAGNVDTTKPSIEKVTFTDTDLDAGEIAGELKVTATNAAKVKVQIGDLVLESTNGTVTVPENTKLDDAVITVTSAEGKIFKDTYTLEDETEETVGSVLENVKLSTKAFMGDSKFISLTGAVKAGTDFDAVEVTIGTQTFTADIDGNTISFTKVLTAGNAAQTEATVVVKKGTEEVSTEKVAIVAE